MKLPVQAQPVVRNTSVAEMTNGKGVNPSFDFGCIIQCGAALAQCIGSGDPVQCLINAGMSKCLKCL